MANWFEVGHDAPVEHDFAATNRLAPGEATIDGVVAVAAAQKPSGWSTSGRECAYNEGAGPFSS